MIPYAVITNCLKANEVLSYANETKCRSKVRTLAYNGQDLDLLICKRDAEGRRLIGIYGDGRRFCYIPSA